MATDPRGQPTEALRSGAITRSEEDTAVEGDWPVVRELAPALVEEASHASEEEAQLVVERPGRPTWRGALLLVLVLLVLALAGALLWVVVRDRGGANESPPPAATAGGRSGLPRLVGFQLPAARQKLTARGLSVDVRQTRSSRGRGTVLAQSPAPGTRVRHGASVLLVVAGAQSSGAPNLVGLRLEQTSALLGKAGFRVRVQRVESGSPKDVVLRQSPAAGEPLERGGVVTLTVSSGTPQAAVPRVVGLSAAEATQRLKAAGLEADVHQQPSSERAGTVTGQNPGADAHVDRGSTVRLDVARSKTGAAAGAPTKPAKVMMPLLVGLQSADAVARLRALGLRASFDRTPSSKAQGTVLAQSTVAGAQLRRGMTVSLRVSSGPAAVTVPDTTGASESSARQQLTSAGFKVEVVDQSVSDPTQDGMVVDQTPAGGASAHKGDTVTITVGRASGG